MVAFASVWFFIIVLFVGEAAYLVALVTKVIYSGTLSWYVVLELSWFLSFFLSADFVAHYRKDMGVEEDFWENIVP